MCRVKRAAATLAQWSSLALVVFPGLRAEAQVSAPEFSRFLFVDHQRQHFAVAFPPDPAEWLRLEVSSSLTNWTERANVIAARQTYLFVDTNAGADPIRVYRLVRPGISLEEAQDRWRSNNVRAYRCKFWSLNALATGSLIVRNGQKTITDVTDRGTGEPYMDFDPNHAPDVDELFALMSETIANTGNFECRVTYDSRSGFPAHVILRPSRWLEYILSDFEVLE